MILFIRRCFLRILPTFHNLDKKSHICFLHKSFSSIYFILFIYTLTFSPKKAYIVFSIFILTIILWGSLWVCSWPGVTHQASMARVEIQIWLSQILIWYCNHFSCQHLLFPNQVSMHALVVCMYTAAYEIILC